MPPNETGATDLRGYLAVVRRRKWVIVGATVVVVALALVFSFLQTPLYEGTARVLLKPTTSVFDPGGFSFSDPSFVQTEIELLQGERVRKAVAEKLGAASGVMVTPVGSTSAVEVKGVSNEPKRAADIANAYAEAYLQVRQMATNERLTSTAEQLKRTVDSLQKEIDDLSQRLAVTPPCVGVTLAPNCAQRDSLQADRDARITQQSPLKTKLSQVEVDRASTGGGPQLIASATVPTSPVRPKPLRNGIAGLGLGLVVGTALAFVFNQFDDSIRTKDDLERAVPDVVVLGIIPVITGLKGKGDTVIVSRDDPNGQASEAYRSLRTSIRFLGLDQSVRVVQVTSPNASEGKTTTVANLAIVMARAGARVAVVGCDLRQPRIHALFGLPNDIGFTTVLLGEAPLSAALQQVPGEPRLSVLASGPVPPNPSELISSPRTAEVMSALRGVADIVLIDCPPVLPVTDAVALSSQIDATLLVAYAGSTDAKALIRATQLLRQVGAQVLGAVLNGVRDESSYGGDYGYRYRHGADQGDGDRSRPSALGALPEPMPRAQKHGR